jgi:hypothetical protein
MQSLTGVSHHAAYVCFDPKIDVFRIVDFDRPDADRYSSYTSQMPPGFMMCADSLGDKHRLSWDAVSLWLKDIDSFSSYACGSLSMEVYQDGVLADIETESGRWKRIGKPQPSAAFVQDASFQGTRLWVKEWNEKNEQKLAAEDDSTHLHAGVDPTQINVEYAYENQAGGTTNYNLTIQRSTLRFSESTSLDNNDTISVSRSGTCMVFK